MQKDNKFRFKHSLGQNFLSDDQLLNSIVVDAFVKSNSNILEIGAGAGALTTKLCQKANDGHVFSVEIDQTLQPILQKKLKNFDNVNLIFGDILKLEPKQIVTEFQNEPFKVVANLPYYITTPILEYLLENDFKITDITVMVQLEVAKRLCAEVGTKDYGAITPILRLYGNSRITRVVDKTMFKPQPKVDSAVVHIEIDKNNTVDKKEVSSVIKKCFLMRRKTLQNNLMASFGLDKLEAQTKILNLGLPINVRAEELSLEQFVQLSNIIKGEK